VTRQTPTFADLQAISRKLDRLRETRGSFTVADALRVARPYRGGRDSWGNPYLFEVRTTPSFSFLAISTGRDGRLDVADASNYFSWPQENIVGKLDRDIVFRDGAAVTIGSPK
jgi:hypothetical protein